MDGPRRRTAREVPQAGGEALDPALRHRLETLMADASRSGGGKWVEALRELADISDSPAAQREVFAFFARRLEARREPVIELQELARAIRRETRPPLPKTLLAALAARTAATSERTAAAALEALRAAGPEGREALGAMAEADPEAEVLRQALRRLAAPKR
jgi:hypothetical protein